MHPQGTHEYFRPLHAQLDPISFDGRNRGLRDAGYGGQFILTEGLEFPHGRESPVRDLGCRER